MSYDCEFINYLIIYNYLNVCLLKLRELYSVFANILNFSIIEKFVYRTDHLSLSKICILRFFSISGYPNTLGKILYSHFFFQLLYCSKILSSGEQSIIVKLLKICQRFLQHTPVLQYRSIDRGATTARDRPSSGTKRGQEEQKHTRKATANRTSTS